MSVSVRRKRHSRDLRCVLFSEDVKDTLRNTSAVTKNPTSSSLKSWERCGDGFLDSPIQKKPKSVCPKHDTARQYLTAEKHRVETEEPVHIAWSSSESEQSDCEESSLPSKRVATPKPSLSRPKPKLNVSSYLQLLNCEADELPAIESDSDLSDDDDDEVRGHGETEPDKTAAISDCVSPEKDKCEEKQPQEIQKVPDVDISDYPSDGEDGPACETASSTDAGPCPVDPSEGGRRSLRDWVRSAQALLQTPQKQANSHFKTPDDSNKKRRKFESGGLADRLNRLQSRQRSAISFWRHQSTVDISTAAGKPGVLAVQVLRVQEDCGLSVALCQRRKEVSPEGQQNPAQGQQDAAAEQEDAGESNRCLVLFSRETVAQLAPSPGDLIHVHPPWQTLIMEGERCPVILNAHFSQKVLPLERRSHMAPSPKHHSQAQRCSPYPLNRCWGLWLEQSRAHPPTEGDSGGSRRQAGVCERGWPEPGGVCDSLLEALESLGPAGALSQRLEVVLQRVYCLHIPQSSPLRLQGLRRSPHAPSPRNSSSSSTGRLCVLVQDAWGMFSEVQLQALSSEEQFQLLARQWEGRSCQLQGVKVLQRVTRDRCAPLFSLIDSLWPPTLPLKVHGDSLSCEENSTAAAAPSFCYRLSGNEASVAVSQEMPLSLLYQPPVMLSLREILQGGKEGDRYSFTANVVFRRLQDSGSDAGDAENWLLFVTDASLQAEEEPRPGCPRRTLTVCFRPAHALQHSVRQAITATSSSSSSSSCCLLLTFRDALLQRGCIVCLEQTTVRLAGAPEDILHPDPLPKPLRLDQLGPETPPNTLCTLTGVVVGVDEETAYSWPVCSLCESERLEKTLAMQESFLCTVCGAAVVKPIVKMQLEVFLNCLSLSDCTIKMKLQQRTIDSILSSLGGDPEFYEVESVLGKEVGPVSAYVRVITRTPGLWVGLEEVCL
ncbi:DNA repair-scaffolding protein [Sardina pilchardus]|uniref:DNA repair-scaffolding protein n=1 Tax=Sardina pilchardus TaxID=27697 RepID=UPI002E0D24E5